MIVCLYLEDHQYLTAEPQTLNFGGKYLYSFRKEGKNLVVNRKHNDSYIPHFFNVVKSKCKLQLLSAVVGENGSGKSSILDIIRAVFSENPHAFAYSNITLLVEEENETKLLKSSYDTIYLQETSEVKYTPIKKAKFEDYQSIYYSPHFDLKYKHNFDDIDSYDISLDHFIKKDLESTRHKGTSESGVEYDLHDELLFKNAMRQIEFLNSDLFASDAFKGIFEIPDYKRGVLYFRDIKFPKSYNDTPFPLRTIIQHILSVLEGEKDNWHTNTALTSIKSAEEKEAAINRYFLERFVIKTFLSVTVDQMEKSNRYLDEGTIDDPYNTDRFSGKSAFEIFHFFIENSYIQMGREKKAIFNSPIVISFVERLYELFRLENNPDFIRRQSVEIDLSKLKEVVDLHKKVVTNLIHYYSRSEGLFEKLSFVNGFIDFRPTDKSMSSGENALLNFYSKLYTFIENNLTEDRRFLPEKKNYILLLDEADLGFHPVWKRKYVHAILRTIPYFFESLEIKPTLQIVITTHDPLTLSDIPANNVVFLLRSEEKCVVAGKKDESKIQKTFGANITDLLADSFFIGDGLIGDFAKSKIEEVITWIEKERKKSSSKRASIMLKRKILVA